MISRPPKTLSDHRAYLYDIVRLKLWYLHRFLTEESPGSDFRQALRTRVDIYRKTDCNRFGLNPTPAQLEFDAPPWRQLEDELEALFRRYAGDAAMFETEGFELLRPSLDRRAPYDYIDVSRMDGYQCGSLRYEPQEPGLFRETVIFHIANAIQPQSIFDEPDYLTICLEELMRQTEMRYGCTRLCCDSWLNSNPRWLERFPEEYRNNREPEHQQISWHYGFWGQFITARGVFNTHYGESFRATGRMPYLPCRTSCSFTELRRFLKSSR